MKEIKIDPEQLRELLRLCENFGTIGDNLAARAIYAEGVKQAGGNCHEWAHSCALGNLLRIGYIMGQRAERSRKASGAAMLTGLIS